MGAAAEHVFIRRNASPALKAAMEGLAQRMGRSIDEMELITLGDAFELAQRLYGGELPEFWRIWNEWNTAPEEPRPMGDL